MSEESKILKVSATIEQFDGKVDGIVNKVLNLIGDHPWEKWLANANKFISTFLPPVIALAGILACLVGLVTSIKNDARISQVTANFTVLLLTVFSLHLAPKALALARSLVEKGTQEAVRPELLYILKVVLGFGGLLAGLYSLLQFSVDGLVLAILLFIVAAILIIAFSRPGCIGMRAAYPGNVVEEVFGISLLPLKLVISLLTPIIAIATVGGLVYGVVQMFDNGMVAALTLSTVALLPAVLPLAVYLVLLVILFIVDLLRALAQIPTKLDEVKEKLK